ncbi:RNA dependent RNA polymerase-domain-containing protein [Phyllosticta citricarpa]|uniref:RNA-dependent RNA polymerase n=2 Tax=Phyllosticta TaxID=121621 RepID=A0ABR1LUT5_9PEZI
MNRSPVTQSSRQSPVPQKKTDHQIINEIIIRIENRWRLGLTIRDATWSPCRQPPNDPGKCFDLIRFHYWRARDLLPLIEAEFNDNASSMSPRERLPYLRRLLERSKATVVPASPRALSTTPSNNRVAPVSPSTRYDLRSNPSLKPFLVSGKSSVTGQMTSRSPLGSIEPSTPKHNDERDMTPPPSPSLEASRRHNKSTMQPNRKRSSEEFEDRGSSKCSRSVSGKRNSLEFAVPAPPSARKDAHDSRSSSRTSGMSRSTATSATSLTSTESSRTDSVFSKYRENASANTSFTTEATLSQSGQHFHSSGTVSWDDETKEDVMQCLRQDEALIRPLQGPLQDLEIELSQESQVCISPGKSGEQHQLKNLPRDALFVPEVGKTLQNLPFKQRWEYVRVAQIVGSDPEDLVQSNSGELQDYEKFWSRLMQHQACQDRPDAIQRSSQKAWEAANFENVKLKGSLTFNPSNVGPLFKLYMQPLRTETSCRFQRAFGGDRFLYVEVPPFDALPSHLKNQHGYLPHRFVEWLAKPKQFLGRSWMVFFVDPLQPKKRRGERTEMRGYQVVLFAMGGCDLRRQAAKVSSRAPRQAMDIFDLLNWFMPLKEPNVSQAFPKAFARIALGLTTTIPGLSFKPSQVKYVPDIVADGTPEDHEFDDSALDWPIDQTTERVMNDGCARISVGAAQKLWQNIGKGGPLPSTFQGRIGGAKGMWIISAASDTCKLRDKEIWIEINNSQLKFQPHEDDLDDALYDPQRLTFDLHSITDQAASSKIYLSFFPILQDRGVAEENLIYLFDRYLEQERAKLVDSMYDPVSLRKWVNDQNSTKEERNREDGIDYQAAMPTSHQEKLVLLLESGFDPSCPFVSEMAERFVSTSLHELRMNVRIPLPRCTYIKGVADPLRVLKPGEVHICFSQSLTDEVSGESINLLHDRSVLVARNPALRRSDIQKVKATFRLELAHLRDVVVFPSLGQYPLAGKLQGGDYDGDTFWVCWDPNLVEPFKNAPAPLQDPTPGDYGIEVDKRSLKELLQKERSSSKHPSIQNFLRASFEYRCKTSLLGQATKLHEKICYKSNTIDSPKINALADLHDLLVDSAKNGYSFDHSAFDKFKKTSLGLRGNVEEPAYETARKNDKLEKGKLARGKDTKHKKHNIIDRIYFGAIVPHTWETFKVVSEHFKRMQADTDEDLLAPYKAAEEDGKQDPDIEKELKQLNKAIKRVKDRWTAFAQSRDFENLKPGESYDDVANECFAKFVAITPTNTTHSIIKCWTRRATSAFTEWELLKASALYKYSRKNSLSFVFLMAGKWLCWIKASKAGDSHLLVRRMWSNMKPRRIKKVIREGRQQRSDGNDLEDGDEVSDVENDGTTV